MRPPRRFGRRAVTRRRPNIRSTIGGPCNCAWMPPTASSSSSRSAAGPCPRRRPPGALFALRQAPAGLARTLLDEVVSSDARLAWSGAAVSLAGEGPGDLPLEAAAFVVFDLETTGLSARNAEICEIGAVRLRGLEPAGTFQTFVRPRTPLPSSIAALTGIRDARPPAGASAGRRGAPVPRVRRRLRARRAQRPLRPRVPRPGGRALRGQARGRARAGHGRVSPARCSAGGPGGRASRRSRATTGRRSTRATARSRTRRRRPRSSSRSSASPRSAGRGPSPTCSGSPRRAPGARTTSARSRSARRSGPASTSSAARATRCSTSAGPATCAPGCARTSAPTASVRRWRPRSRRSSGSSGACSAPSSRRRSRSCASSASCGRPRTRAGRGPTGTSTWRARARA